MRCEEKRAYKSYNRALDAVTRQFVFHPELRRLAIYQCPACGKYHLTSARQRRKADTFRMNGQAATEQGSQLDGRGDRLVSEPGADVGQEGEEA